MHTDNVRTSGGIFTHNFIESIQQERVNHPALKADRFTFIFQERMGEAALEEKIAEAWEVLVDRWDAVEREFGALDISTLRQRWLRPFFSQLGFNLEFNRADLVLEEDFRFPISHLGFCGTTSGTIPIHSVLYQVNGSFDTKAAPGRGIKAMAPHDMLQRYLNLSKEHTWGILTDGVNLRLLRNFYHTYSRGFTEFDLQGIFSNRDFTSFRALFRLLHASRFVVPEGAETAPIADLYESALSQGVDVGNKLRENVQAAIETLGNGFLTSSPGFIDALRNREDGPQQLYRDILVTIYRVLFLLFAEQRNMLPGRGSLYHDEFSLTALRTLAERPQGDDPNFDLWEKLKTTFAMVEHGVPDLKIYPYNGALFSMGRTPLLTPHNPEESPRCQNDALLTTIAHLTTVVKEGVVQRISYSDLSVEEIGSIYESLLDTTPRISETALEINSVEYPPNAFFLDPRGKDRKTSGSYYTPPSLVNELIKSALEPALLDRLNAAVPGYDSDTVEALTQEQCALLEDALLNITVVDPAAGSGAFLIAANNRLGLELGRIRARSIFPPDSVLRHARRDVLTRCIHGVDLNPMAVELCKVSLWINAAVEDAPLNFLDHHIQCGNSLVGATPALVNGGVPDGAYNPVRGDDKTLAKSLKARNRQERAGQDSLTFKLTHITNQAELKHWQQARDLAGSDPAQAEQAYHAYQVSQALWDERLPYDLWTAAFFTPLKKDALVPTSQDVRQAKADPQLVNPGLKALARAQAEAHRFFHWHLAFPEVFNQRGEGGFDVVLGNPPWERIEIKDKDFFALRDNQISTTQSATERKQLIENLVFTNPILWFEYTTALNNVRSQTNFLRTSNNYPLAGRRNINLYQVFSEVIRTLINERGRAGFIIPTGIATDETCRFLFADWVTNNQIVSLYDFENRKKLFPIHAQYKFTLLTLKGKEVNPCSSTDFSFFLLHPDDLQNSDKISKLFLNDFLLLNPNTLTSPIFRTKDDLNLTKKFYQKAPILNNTKFERNTWGLSFNSVFLMTADAHLFKTQSQLEKIGFTLQGNCFVKNSDTFLPLYEAKMFHQFDHRYGTYEGIKSRSSTHLNNLQSKKPGENSQPWYWVSLIELNNKFSSEQNYHLCFRDVTNATNERTAIFSVSPVLSNGHTAPLMICDFNNLYKLCLLTIFNSFSVDFIVRNKVGGLHLSIFILEQLPILTPDSFTRSLMAYIVPKAFELVYTAWDLQGFADDLWSSLASVGAEADPALIALLHAQRAENAHQTGIALEDVRPPNWAQPLSTSLCPIPPFIWDDERRFQLRADLDALIAHLYNLTHDELDYILETFPIVKRNDLAQYGEYRTKRVILEKFDALGDDPLLEGACTPLAQRVSVLKHPPASTPNRPAPTQPAIPSASLPQPEPVTPTPQDPQPNLFSLPAAPQSAPKRTATDYSLYRCPLCDLTLLGFTLEEHTRDAHAGTDPGYLKLD